MRGFPGGQFLDLASPNPAIAFWTGPPPYWWTVRLEIRFP